MFMWRILINGLFTMERASRMGHGRGFCTIFHGVIETCNHLFFSCYKASLCWAQNAIYFEATPTDYSLSRVTSFLEVLGNGLYKTPSATTCIYVIYQACWALWLQRNECVFNHKFPNFPPSVAAEQATTHLEAALQYTNLTKKIDK